ncbi:TadE/TadG family type IV pilus assembly protein [Dongia sp.]|uniref:TadE/TadG family type IV pilus assembly protein n=1 Tax=Dongia sp. TaxID=1977262 RepID=UPI0035B46898
MKRRHGFRRDSRGLISVEFALIAPALILFLLGIIEWGRYMYAYNTLEFGCAQAARWGVFHITGTASAIEDYAKQEMVGITPGTVKATIDADTNTVEVTAEMTFVFMTSAVAPVPSLKITARAKM